jgi:hypothetical protein
MAKTKSDSLLGGGWAGAFVGGKQIFSNEVGGDILYPSI